MKFNVSVGKTSAGGQGWTHDFSFKAFNSPAPNAVPMCIGNTSVGWRHLVKWGVDASGNGWSHLNCVYVYPMPQPGTFPFTVSHKEDHWRWKIREGNGISAQDIQNGWKQDFIFYAFPPTPELATTPVAVGHAKTNYGSKFIAKVGHTSAEGQGWSHLFTFEAFNYFAPNTVPICIGNTSAGWRWIVKWGVDASGNGWSHLNRVYVYPTPQPGTVPFTVSHKEDHWRSKISKGNGLSAQEIQWGWKQDFVFYGFPDKARIPVSVGRAKENYGVKFSVAVGKTSAGGQGWNHEFTFEALNSPSPNAVPICIGNSSESDWSHLHCVYVYPTPQPGTVPFTVSHKEDHWRWKIAKGNGLSAQEIQWGWKQDFVFHAFAAQDKVVHKTFAAIYKSQ